MRPTLLLPALAVALGCAHSRPDPEEQLTELKPRYHPPSEALTRAPPCAAISRLTVREMHQPANVLGSRWSEDDPEEKEVVTVDVVALGAWARDAVDRSLGRASLNTHSPDKPELRVRLTRISVDEKAAFNSEYDALVTLEAAIHRPGSPEPCWNGRAEGTGHNYGRSATPDNYDEALNKALDMAVVRLLAIEGFYDALCDRCPGQPPSGL